MRLSPWWLLAAAIAIGAALTGIVGAVGSEHLTALDWLGTTATVAAVVIAVGIYRLQERSGSEAHQELMEQLEAQGELLNDYAERAADKGKEAVPDQLDALTSTQRTSIEDAFGKDSIADALDPGRRGRGGRGARLVRLHDGRLVSVYDRHGQIHVREVSLPPGQRRPSRSRTQ
jgi:hypothetical protein